MQQKMYELEKRNPRYIWMGLGQANSSSVKVTHKERQCDPFSIHLFYLVIVKTDPAQLFDGILFGWFEELQL